MYKIYAYTICLLGCSIIAILAATHLNGGQCLSANSTAPMLLNNWPLFATPRDLAHKGVNHARVHYADNQARIDASNWLQKRAEARLDAQHRQEEARQRETPPRVIMRDGQVTDWMRLHDYMERKQQVVGIIGLLDLETAVRDQYIRDFDCVVGEM